MLKRELNDPVDEFLKKVVARVLEEIAGPQINQKSIFDILMLCHITKFGVVDENLLVNLMLTFFKETYREFQYKIPELRSQNSGNLWKIFAQKQKFE